MEDGRLRKAGERWNFQRRNFLQKIALGTIGGFMGLKLLRSIGLGRKILAHRPSKSPVQVKPNTLAVPRVKEKA